MNGPAIIIDKSFVHRLKASHLFELQVFFTIVPTPILKREILSNLAKPSNDETDWVSVARSLCRKLSTSHVDLIYYRTAALSELLTGDFVPMNGVPILNADAPHVSFQNGGIFIDGKVVQAEWRRWADGEFTAEEKQQAESFRNEIDELDMSGMTKLRTSMGKLFAHCKTQDALVKELRTFIDDPSTDKQAFLLQLAMANLGADNDQASRIETRFARSGAKTIRDFSPYAASVTQVMLTWMAIQARGFHGPRKSDMCDIEYLFYTPFCKVFASCDRLHKTLWGATTTDAILCDGDELLADLANRAELRRHDPDRVKGAYPVTLERSVITRIFEKLRNQ